MIKGIKSISRFLLAKITNIKNIIIYKTENNSSSYNNYVWYEMDNLEKYIEPSVVTNHKQSYTRMGENPVPENQIFNSQPYGFLGNGMKETNKYIPDIPENIIEKYEEKNS